MEGGFLFGCVKGELATLALKKSVASSIFHNHLNHANLVKEVSNHGEQ